MSYWTRAELIELISLWKEAYKAVIRGKSYTIAGRSLTSEELRSYGLDQAIIALFQPYLGKRKDAAIAVLRKWPLVISQNAAMQTDLAVHDGYLNRHVIPVYEKASGVIFASLPKEAQAAIMSVCYHLGPTGARTGAPKLWNYLVRRDWQAASHELMSGFKKYAGRRKKEGQLLRELC